MLTSPGCRATSLLLHSLLLFSCAGLLSACATPEENAGDSADFATYQLETQLQLNLRRNFQTAETLSELEWNSPKQWHPATDIRPSKGILLVHGLGDSPWSFHDLAPILVKQGFLVRTVLLPGHGTRPEDLLGVDLKEWQRVVREQSEALQRDVEHVYLGGFSTGANLVLEYAYGNPDVAGLLLFSPGFRSSSQWDWLTPLAAWLRPWLIAPDGLRPMQNSVRYFNTPTNGFAQFYRSSHMSQRLLAERPYDKPVLMVVAQHDSVLDTRYLLDKFQHRFTHPASRLIWYGDIPIELFDRRRVLVREDSLPSQRISQFSHMGLLFSPSNTLYGEHGSLRICLNGQQAEAMQACEQGAPVWYSDWGYREDGKVHARLTFNPYFDWQASVMVGVLSEPAPSSASKLTRSAQERHPEERFLCFAGMR